MAQQRTATPDDMARSYGFQGVDPDTKQDKVNDVFHRVARRYDVMNDVMSGGMHRLWKDAMVSWLAPSKTRSYRVLDVAGGTGDIASRIVEASARNATVTVLDINGSMLDVGRDRAAKSGLGDRLDFIEASAEDLPFDDASFDAYTIAFGIRNVPHIDKALAEAFRVLKPGGRFLCLEFSDVDAPLLEKAYDAWSFNVIPRLGEMIAGDGEPYRYLIESIRMFPDQERFAAMIRSAGFERVGYRNYSGGIAACHSGWKF